MSPKVLFALAAATISLSLNAVVADPQLYLRAMNLTKQSHLFLKSGDASLGSPSRQTSARFQAEGKA
jgi:hypothetical protein